MWAGLRASSSTASSWRSRCPRQDPHQAGEGPASKATPDAAGLSASANQQLRVTGLVSPFGFAAVQWKICVVTGWKMSSVMLVRVRVGFTPVQLGFGHPAVAASTVGAAVSVAGFVVNVRFPFLIALAGIAVSEVAGPSRTLFWPVAVLAPPFWHW